LCFSISMTWEIVAAVAAKVATNARSVRKPGRAARSLANGRPVLARPLTASTPNMPSPQRVSLPILRKRPLLRSFAESGSRNRLGKRERMIRFSTVGLMDEQKCYGYLVDIPHPNGLCCRACKTPVEHSKVQPRERAPIVYFRCCCGRDYNASAGTLWGGTHHRCSMIVRLLQGVAPGPPDAASGAGAEY
jgi:hypothetical protein